METTIVTPERNFCLKKWALRSLAGLSLCSSGAALAAAPAPAAVHEGNWLHWRGPMQTGVSLERYEAAKFNPEPVWTLDLAGRGTPVVHNGRLYAWGYRGAGPDLVEVLAAVEPATGKVIWERTFSDFMSDTVYDRYSIGSPVVDPETGHIYLHTAYGLFNCHDRDGKLLWEISLMERFGRLTFPNGRAGSCSIEGDLVITRAVNAYWGADGPAKDRFFAFDKRTGDLVWTSAPGVGGETLKDSSFSSPFFATRNGRRVMYSGTGCGNVVCLNVADGKPLWSFQFTVGGVNASPVLWRDSLVTVHGTENMDTTETGRMAAIRLPKDDANPGGAVDPELQGAAKVPEDVEIWRQPICAFTSSPVLVGNRLYQVSMEGMLSCLDAETGKPLWQEKLDTEQIHASPAYADGLLFVPMSLQKLFVIRPSDEKCEILHQVAMKGNCLGSPAICNGRVYVHTMEKLYAFEIQNQGIRWDPVPPAGTVDKGSPAALRAIPADILLEPGDSVAIRVELVDASGNPVGEAADVAWESFIPPTARVKSSMDAGFESSGQKFVAKENATESAGMFRGTSGSLQGFVRGRVIQAVPFSKDFEDYELTVDHPVDKVKFAYPPLPWIGARLKWEVREMEGNKVLAKSLDNILFQRSMSFIGHPDSADYTIQADVMTDGNRRIKSTVGLINQRYIVALVGNSNKLEISSNYERVQESVPFAVAANQWYTLKTRVDLAGDGSGVVRAKVWDRAAAEPEGWTLEYTHRNAHKKGAPGLFGFAPQSQKSVYIDNIKITPNP